MLGRYRPVADPTLPRFYGGLVGYFGYDLIRTIERLFEDKRGVTTLATIHKAKGLEANTVYWLNSSQCPSKYARQDWQKQQEANLCYVAATRAKRELVLIEETERV